MNTHPHFPTVASCVFAILLASPSYADQATPPSLSPQDQQALELGRKVIKARHALKTPGRQSSIADIRDLGLDSRYYVMTRGWITQHISMAESYRGTSKYKQDEKWRKEIDDRITALKKLLRAIDLE